MHATITDQHKAIHDQLRRLADSLREEYQPTAVKQTLRPLWTQDQGRDKAVNEAFYQVEAVAQAIRFKAGLFIKAGLAKEAYDTGRSSKKAQDLKRDASLKLERLQDVDWQDEEASHICQWLYEASWEAENLASGAGLFLAYYPDAGYRTLWLHPGLYWLSLAQDLDAEDFWASYEALVGWPPEDALAQAQEAVYMFPILKA